MGVIFWYGLFCLYHYQSVWIDDSLSLIARWLFLFCFGGWGSLVSLSLPFG